MNKSLILGLLVAVALAVPGFVSATPGAIWTTTGSCGSPQNANHYAIGDNVYINAANMPSGSTAWDITGQPGGASCDPSQVVASGNQVVGENGAICFLAYTVQPGDCGEYKATLGNKHDNYQVDAAPGNAVPEFGVAAAALVLVGAAGFVFMRRN